MKDALADKPPTPFRVPPGIEMVPVDLKTGARAGPDERPASIMEAFKAGTAPGDDHAVRRLWRWPATRTVPPAAVRGNVPPDAGRAVRAGTGGLY